MASIAVFMALGGVTYAATALPKNSVGTKQIRKKAVTNIKLATNSVTGNKVKDGTLTGKDIKTGTLTLQVGCRAGTFAAFGACVEAKAHGGGQVGFVAARKSCADLGGRMPTRYELDLIRDRPGLEWAAGNGPGQYEWTSTMATASLPRMFAISQSGQAFDASGSDTGATAYFRCVLPVTNR